MAFAEEVFRLARAMEKARDSEGVSYGNELVQRCRKDAPDGFLYGGEVQEVGDAIAVERGGDQSAVQSVKKPARGDKDRH